MSSSWLPLCFLPHLALPVVAIDVLPTVPVDVSSGINVLEAGVWCWTCPCTEETHVADSHGAQQPISPHANRSLVLFLGWFEHEKFLLSPPSEQGRRKGSSDFATDNRYGRYYCLTQGE